MKKILFASSLLLAALLFSGCKSRPTLQNTPSWNLPKKLSIVLPAKPYDGTVLRAYKEGAEGLQELLKECGGDAVIRTATQPDMTRGTINIGFPDGKEYAYFAGGITFRNGAVLISGNDRLARSLKKGKNNSYYHYHLGSIKALTVFMERFLGARFVLPEKVGIGRLPEAVKAMPLNGYVRVDNQWICGAGGRHFSLLYDYANNNYGSGSIYLYGGHSHYLAIPIAQYGKTHPEYFSVLDGMRSWNQAYYSYCHSNPAVRELIYQEMLRKLDAGAEFVELSQTDGYRGCECDKCKNLFGTTDEAEKVWIMHKQMAERLMKDRPGKKVMIISYNPTQKPPKTFRKFPANTMIELCCYSPKDFEEWKNYEVPQGFIVYVYNWGYYQIQGLTPKFTPALAAEQVRRFRANGIRGMYRCGFGELMGVEGPGYYAYGKLIDNPALDPQQLLREYCLASYGTQAGTVMEHFFNKLNKVAESGYLEYHEIDVQVQRALGPARFLVKSYSPALLKDLESKLSTAEKLVSTPKEKIRLGVVRTQFNYLKDLLTILYFYDAYQLKPSHALLNPLLDMVDARNQMIDKVLARNIQPGFKSMHQFGVRKKDAFTVNGRNSGTLSVPLTWNTKSIRKFNVLPGMASKKAAVQKVATKPGTDFNAGVWKKLPWMELSEIQLAPLKEKSRFKLCYDEKNFYVGVEMEMDPARKVVPAGRDAKCWKWDCLELVIDPWGSRQKNYHFIVSPVENSCYDATAGMIADPLHPLYSQDDPSWNGVWSYDTKRDGKIWRVLFTIPFETLKVQTPGNADSWSFNVCRESFLNGPKGDPELSCWSPCFEARSFQERSTWGTLNFNR